MFGRRRPPRRKLSTHMFGGDFGLEAKNARVLERIYHKGQRLAWDGKEVLDSLIAEHGQPDMPPEQKQALGRVFAVIMWGELAAWRISAQLADEIVPLEPKMAATSQAFDEARHFYVMHDYLEALGCVPDDIDRGARVLLETVMNADSLPKKLLGMQLMIEPLALTLFHLIKGLNPEPVLTHLLPYYERDEARHVALGVRYLPALLDRLSTPQSLSLWGYQFVLMSCEIWSSYGLSRDLMRLGVDPNELIRVGRGKQLAAMHVVFENSSIDMTIPELVFNRYVDFLTALTMPDMHGDPTPLTRVRRAVSSVLRPREAEEFPLNPEVSDAQVPLIRGVQTGDSSPHARTGS